MDEQKPESSDGSNNGGGTAVTNLAVATAFVFSRTLFSPPGNRIDPRTESAS